MKQGNQSRQNSAEVVRFFSKLNAKELPYYAILPYGYKNSNESFPVLYLLHGLFGQFDNWITNTNLINYAQNFPFIIVCAEGGDSWYTDSLEIENHFFESYLTEELIPDVESRFKVKTHKNFRAIAGLSMGGYGAFKLAFRRPEMFCLAAATSGAFHAAEIADSRTSDAWKELKPSICRVFGLNNRQIRLDNDLFRLASNFPLTQINRLPYFYFDCGTEDSFLPVNLRLAEIFQKRGISHRFQQCSGAHDWNYWDRQIQSILQVAENHLTV